MRRTEGSNLHSAALLAPLQAARVGTEGDDARDSRRAPRLSQGQEEQEAQEHVFFRVTLFRRCKHFSYDIPLITVTNETKF